GADDGDLDDQVVQATGPEPRQHVDLGPALDLEDADGLASTQHVVNGRVLAREGVQFPVLVFVGADQVERLADAGQHPQRQNIDLHRPQSVDVVLVPFDEGAVGPGGAADGDHLV